MHARETNILLVNREPMIDPRRQDEQIPWLGPDPHPLVLCVPDVEVSSALQDIPDLFLFMQMFLVEHGDFVLVGCAHGVRRDGNLITVGVVASLCQLFHLTGRRG